MPAGYPLLFFVSALSCGTLLVFGLNYYLRTRQDALVRRVEELQEQSMTGAPGPSLGGDVWDVILRSTYGLVFGRSWFRQKEMELMRAGYRGSAAVKTFGIASLAFMVALCIAAFFFMKDDDLTMRLLGMVAAVIFGYLIPEQAL